jgi:hypothetical protein
MTFSKKIFWTMVALEVTAAGYVGWQIANAQLHPWARQPKPAKRPVPSPVDVPKPTG